eukprot:366388-Chlamydomonas_euryale.AAC.9
MPPRKTPAPIAAVMASLDASHITTRTRDPCNRKVCRHAMLPPTPSTINAEHAPRAATTRCKMPPFPPPLASRLRDTAQYAPRSATTCRTALIHCPQPFATHKAQHTPRAVAAWHTMPPPSPPVLQAPHTKTHADSTAHASSSRCMAYDALTLPPFPTRHTQIHTHKHTTT